MAGETSPSTVWVTVKVRTPATIAPVWALPLIVACFSASAWNEPVAVSSVTYLSCTVTVISACFVSPPLLVWSACSS